ncbi:hypothetical protein [Mariniblastus fucicola]|uniref:hypothetical protein n=1 Tax=Mariniblastus fucicola TaxID=980251 RepID=UPI0011DF132A|nr:hypothetical protein [Mariniblastus fucicola]
MRAQQSILSATVIILLATSSLGVAQSAAPVRIPSDANAFTSMNYVSLRESEWARSNSVAAGDLIGMPASAKRVTLASKVDYDYWTSSKPVVVAELDVDRNFDRLPARFDAQRDNVDGRKALQLISGAVAVEMDAAYAIVPNTSRQSAARQIRNLTDAKRTGHDSAALHAAAEFANESDVFAVIAMDLRDSIPGNAVSEYCDSARCLEAVNREAIRGILGGVEGVTISIAATDELGADIRIRFATDPSLLKDVAAPLIDDLLIGYGAKLESIERWETNIADNVVSLKGELSFDGLNDLMGLVVQDPQIPKAVRELSSALNLSDAESASQFRENRAKMAAEGQATVGYMLRIRRLLGSLQNRTGISASQSRFWLDRYALRIQQIDDEEVDEIATKFADRTTNALRSMADTLQSTEIDRYRSRNGLATTWLPAAGLRSLSYGRVPVQRQGNFFGGYGLAAFAIGRALERDAETDAFRSVKRSGFAVVRDYNVTGDAIGEKYGISFQPWTPIR